jgi:hypothetical protein
MVKKAGGIHGKQAPAVLLGGIGLCTGAGRLRCVHAAAEAGKAGPREAGRQAGRRPATNTPGTTATTAAATEARPPGQQEAVGGDR